MMTATAMHAARRCVREAVEQAVDGRAIGEWTAWHALVEGAQPDAKVEATYDRLIDASICCMIVVEVDGWQYLDRAFAVEPRMADVLVGAMTERGTHVLIHGGIE